MSLKETEAQAPLTKSDIKSAQTHDFRLTLMDEFLRRKRNNPRYSMRAFAHSLKMDFSTLSKILRGKRLLGNKAIQKLGAKLGLKETELKKYLKSAAHMKAQSYRQIQMDSFAIISDWYHYAILSLLTLPNFKPDPQWIGKTLGVPPVEIKQAIERLIRVGMLEVPAQGKWKDTTGGFTTTLGFKDTTMALKNHQTQLLRRSQLALEVIPLEQREHVAAITATDSKKIPEAKRMVTNFINRLDKFLSNTENPDTVYAASVGLFPLSHSID